MELNLPSIEVKNDEACVWKGYLRGIHLGIEVDDRPVRQSLLDVTLREGIDYVAILEDLSSSAIMELPLDRAVFIDELYLVFFDDLLVDVQLAS